jgi:hypothetical protein
VFVSSLFEERTGVDLSAGAIAGQLTASLARLKRLITFPPPPVQGLVLTAVLPQLEDRASPHYSEMDKATPSWPASKA